MARPFAAVIVAVLLGPVLPGQEKPIEVRGTVHATNTTEKRKTVTADDASFSFPAVPAGKYRLRVGPAESVTIPPPPGLSVELDIHEDVTLLLPIESDDLCSQTPIPSHYFRLLDSGERKNLAGLSGTVVNEHGDPVDGADVTLFTPAVGRVAATRSRRGGSFSFPQLKLGNNYWLQITKDGYFAGELGHLKLLSGYESLYQGVQLQACQPGHCDPSVRELPVIRCE
ncbi:MAG TPA: carboxypeptidase-like regulatory domain-containing protein [Bryobacteraceae bacterium]|nr:carboxypeptidase-like regulatory domain-containing protein [Bryobacteraceae bacterium]